MTTAYGRTALGQFVYDLCFTQLTARYLARKHGRPVAEIRRLMQKEPIARLRSKVEADRRKVRA